jgi:hypothetical protein
MRIPPLGKSIAILALAGLAMLAPPSAAQSTELKTWTHKELGLAIQRPAELYELDPEPPADDINGEVEWGPKDHAWTILVTSQKPAQERSLAGVAAEIRKQQPEAEIAETQIGDGIAALRVTLLDPDALTAVVYFFDKRGTMLVAIELAIALGAADVGKDRAALKSAHAATLALFDRLIGSVRYTPN